MPFCKNCGNKISDQTKFCANCGTKVSQEESTSNFAPVDLPNHTNTKHIPAKKNSYLKYLLLLVVAVATTFYFIVNGRNSYDLLGYKHGNWIEYVNEDGSQEVPKESAKFIRHIKYSHGYSLELVKDYYPNGNIQSEFELASEPYTKNGVRPKDKMKGYAVLFDEHTSKIDGFIYFDDNGELNLEKTLGLAYEKARTDPRFDEEFFSKTKLGVTIHKLMNKDINTLESLSNTNDELPPMEPYKEFENSSGKSNNQASEHIHENNNNSYKINKSQKVTCYKCNGTGKTICSDCNGKGVAICGSCNGSGKYNAGDGLKTCYYCNGSKWVPCKRCYGKGTTGSCSECNGRGYIFQ